MDSINDKNQEFLLNQSTDCQYNKLPDNLKPFHLYNEVGKATGVFDYAIFKYICDHSPMFVLSGVPYIYFSGAFIPDLYGTKLKTLIRKLILPEMIKSNTITRIYDLFLQADELHKPFSELNLYPPEWINFKNAFYDPVSRKLISHNSEYMAINQIPHSYHPNIPFKGEHIEKWFNFIFDEEDQREMFLQFAGLCLNRDTRQQKFLVLTGNGGTGKSTLIRLLESAVGTDNMSNISLSALNQRFANYGLMGKLLNSCADLELSALDDVSMLKKVLGEDTIRAEQKGKDAIFFKSYSKLIFSANELPQIRDERSDGFYRRLLILPMDKVPPEPMPNFFAKLHSEVDYFIQLSVEALSRMYENGSITVAESSAKSVTQLREDSDSVEAFLNSQTYREKDEKIDRAILYNFYDKYCYDNERPALSKINFFKALRTKGFSEVTIHGDRYFKNIAFKNLSE